MEKKVIDIFPPKEREKKELPQVRIFQSESARNPLEAEEEILETPVFEELPSKTPPRRNFFLKGILLVALLMAAGVAAYLVLGKATIGVWPVLDPLTSETKVTVNRTVQDTNLAEKTIPGNLFEGTTTISEEFLSSGKKTLESKAEGIIRVYNNSSVTQTLVYNTRFQAPLEKFQPALEKGENPWFRISEKIIIPAKGYKDVKAVADSAGEKYNIKASKFSVPGLAGSAQYTLVYGESFQEFKGGEKRQVSQVSSDDLGKAEASLIQKAKEKSLSELQSKISSDNYIFLPDGIKTDIIEKTASVKAGDEAEKFSYRVAVKTAIIAFKKEDLDNFAKGFILSQIGEEDMSSSSPFAAARAIDEKSLVTEYSIFSVEPQLAGMTISLNIKANSYLPFDEQSLKKAILGKSLQEAKLLLEKQEGIKKIEIKLWPFWLKSIPKDIQKVEIKTMLD